MSRYDELLELLDRREDQRKKVEDLHVTWRVGDEHERAAADPGLQFDAENELEELDEAIILECERLANEYKKN